MVIKQRFELTKELQALIKNSPRSQELQPEIENIAKIINEKCRLNDEQISLIDDIAERIHQHFCKAIIIAIGGSLSASKSFVGCKNYQQNSFEVLYSESMAPEKQQALFSKENLKNAAIIIISRSGQSIEVLAQTYYVINRYHQYFGKDYSLGKHFFIITHEKNELQKIGLEIGGTILNYCSSGGKFSALSIVGMLPARLAGFNQLEILNGAKEVLQQYQAPLEAALVNYHLLQKGYSINICSYYNDLLKDFLQRYTQISGEIIAKNNKGFTAIIADGIFDQHGLWQLFLSGPKDKYFTFFSIDKDNSLIADAYHKLNLKRFKAKNIPLREITMKKLDSFHLGALSMHLLLELMFLANLMDIPSITQPDIDRSKKILNKALLSKIKTLCLSL